MPFTLLGSRTFAGVTCAMGASLAFTLNDVGIKFLSGDYPLHQITLFRSIIAVTITLLIIMPLEGGLINLRTRRLGMHLARGLLVVMANMMFFLGLAAIPLAEATAIFFVAPLVITVFSVIFLDEKVGIRRWLAVLAGFFGVIVMLRPGSSAFQMAALFPLVAAVGYAGLHTLTRKIGATEKASTMAFYIQITFIAVSSGIGLAAGHGRYSGSGDPSAEFLLRPWIWPTTPDLGVMAAVGCCSAFGGYFISQAYRMCEAAVIAPFEYLALVLAIIWGIVFFAEWPDGVAWTGIALILGSGLFVFWREAILDRAVASKTPMPTHR